MHACGMVSASHVHSHTVARVMQGGASLAWAILSAGKQGRWVRMCAEPEAGAVAHPLNGRAPCWLPGPLGRDTAPFSAAANSKVMGHIMNDSPTAARKKWRGHRASAVGIGSKALLPVHGGETGNSRQVRVYVRYLRRAQQVTPSAWHHGTYSTNSHTSCQVASNLKTYQAKHGQLRYGHIRAAELIITINTHPPARAPEMMAVATAARTSSSWGRWSSQSDSLRSGFSLWCSMWAAAMSLAEGAVPLQ